ncbi:hypothetical protein GCM10007385_28660 [Tateyamaria omphalii]|nr:hypothetical protein GCM10007385_28660 [Tateyamaria omphalii]
MTVLRVLCPINSQQSLRARNSRQRQMSSPLQVPTHATIKEADAWLRPATNIMGDRNDTDRSDACSGNGDAGRL